MVQDQHKVLRFLGKSTKGGNDARVRVLHHASLSLVDAISVGAWVYFDPYSASMRDDNGIVCKSDGSSGGGGYLLTYENAGGMWRTFRFSVNTGPGVYGDVYLNNSVNELGWYYVIATYDRTIGAPQMKLYVNGFRIAATNYANAILANVRDVYVGSWTNTDWFFSGLIASAHIYNRAISDLEVNNNYLHPNTPVRRGLVMSLIQNSIDKPVGTWKDTSPQTGNNGTIVNATTVTRSCLPAGRNCLFFPTAARTDRVDCGNGASLALGTVISLEFWIKTTRDTAGFMLADKWAANNGYQVMFGSKTIALYSDTGYAIISAVIPDFTNGTWKHVVLTHTDGAASGEVYVNGVNKTNTRAVFALTNSATNLYIGNNAAFTQSLVGGFISAARIYNRILTPAEVAYNYQHANNPIRRGLALNLSPESLYGTQWVDLSGNANHGTITGAVVKNMAAQPSGR